MNHIQQRIVDFDPSEIAPGQLTTLDSMLMGYVHDKATKIEKAFDQADFELATKETTEMAEYFAAKILPSLATRLEAGNAFDRYSAQTVLYTGETLFEILLMMREETLSRKHPRKWFEKIVKY